MEKLAGLLHISRKAGKLLPGRSAVFDGIKKNKVVNVFVARDAGSDLKRKMEKLAAVTVLHLSSEELGRILGRERLSLLGITDNGLADELREVASQASREQAEPTGRN